MNIGIICGSELNELTKNSEKISIETKYGDVIVKNKKLNNNEIFFINRHGENNNIPPHKINYRGNILALKSCNIKNIISIFTVGSMKKNIKKGDLLIPDDFIDFTKSRIQTYYENERVHIDMSYPFCHSLRKLLIESCKISNNIKIHNKGIYFTTEGPRLETASEIKFFSNYADIIGMTLAQEITLAREQGLCYASLCIICNMAAGLQKNLNTDEISKIFIERNPILFKIIKNLIENIENKETCECNII
jgi:5'-methylthioadenosine phosphorylase